MFAGLTQTYLRSARRLIPAVALATVSVPAHAQRGKKAPPEFTTQGLLIVNFTPAAGADMRMGRRAADAVRSRVAHLANKHEVAIIDADEVRYQMEHAGYPTDTTFELRDIRALGKYMRADEFLVATVAKASSGIRIGGTLIMFRDEQLRQPLPFVTGPTLDSAAMLFAKAITAARTQLPAQRRCENALRDGSGSRALSTAREGLTLYPRATIARTCVVWALQQTNAPPAQVLAVAREILSMDSTNMHALEAGAIALDSLHRRDEAASLWLRLAAADTADVDLAVRVGYSLLDGGNAARAEPFVTQLAADHPNDIRPIEQRWRAAYENKHWAAAIEAGQALMEGDSVARADSTFYLHLGTAYHAANQPLRAVETLAHAAAAFPGDVRVYSLYAQYIRAESDTVIPRGLALFPKSADLAAMQAKDYRAHGKLAESLDATRRAVALDSTITEGRLMVAQLEVELGRPDSALLSVRRALAAGEDSARVAQFALAKGNGLYRAANGTKASADFQLALRFLWFADSVRSTPQSKFLVGAAAFGIAQSALTEATTIKDNKAESCRLAQLGTAMLPVARVGLLAGQELFAEAAKQSLEYLDQLEPYSIREIAGYCQ